MGNRIVGQSGSDLIVDSNDKLKQHPLPSNIVSECMGIQFDCWILQGPPVHLTWHPLLMPMELVEVPLPDEPH